jgi:hypothetical protein
MSDRRALREAKGVPDTRSSRAAQTTEGDNDVRGARKTRRSACDVHRAMRAAHSEPRPRACSQAAGIVNVLALAVTFHPGGADLAWRLERLGWTGLCRHSLPCLAHGPTENPPPTDPRPFIWRTPNACPAPKRATCTHPSIERPLLREHDSACSAAHVSHGAMVCHRTMQWAGRDALGCRRDATSAHEASPDTTKPPRASWHARPHAREQ